MAELADALDLGSSVHDVQVQVLSSAPVVNVKPRNGGAFFAFFINLVPFFKMLYNKRTEYDVRACFAQMKRTVFLIVGQF